MTCLLTALRFPPCRNSNPLNICTHICAGVCGFHSFESQPKSGIAGLHGRGLSMLKPNWEESATLHVACPPSGRHSTTLFSGLLTSLLPHIHSSVGHVWEPLTTTDGCWCPRGYSTQAFLPSVSPLLGGFLHLGASDTPGQQGCPGLFWVSHGTQNPRCPTLGSPTPVPQTCRYPGIPCRTSSSQPPNLKARFHP